MAMLLWIDEVNDEAIDLGDPFAAYAAFAEMARVRVAEDESEWGALFSVPGEAEQEVDPGWLAEVRSQAAQFLERYAADLSDGATAILEVLRGGNQE